MNRKYGIALGLCALAWLGFWWLTRQPGPDPIELAGRALRAADLKDRGNAAVELCALQDADATRQMRRLALESKDAEVLVPVLSSLGARADAQTTKLCLDRLDHDAKIVREAALQVLVRMIGEAPDNVDFQVDAPSEARRTAIERLRKLYDPDDSARAAAIAKMPLASAAASVPPEPPLTTRKEAAKDPSKEAPPPSMAPAPVSAPLPHYVPAPLPENPAVPMIAWICRAFALLVLIAMVAGAINLMLGDKDPFARPKNASKTPLTPDERLERILLARNGPNAWTKMGMLVAGGFCVVAFLIAAEIVPLALRVEHKLDYMQRR